MLALSRKMNESIMLGNDIEVTVLEIKGDQVKHQRPYRFTEGNYICRSGSQTRRRRTGISRCGRLRGCFNEGGYVSGYTPAESGSRSFFYGSFLVPFAGENIKKWGKRLNNLTKTADK